MVNAASAWKIIESGLKHARTREFPPMTIAVLDSGGQLVAFLREDDSSLFREKIARAKAVGALGFGVGSRALAARAAAHPAFIAAVTTLVEGELIPVPGGVLVRSEDGTIIGAVGVSGHLPDDDEAVAVAGIRAAGLVADIG
ncbi:MAG TPA: heme-binding protein [Microbacteriaceae bacterium]